MIKISINFVIIITILTTAAYFLSGLLVSVIVGLSLSILAANVLVALRMDLDDENDLYKGDSE